MTIFEGRGDPAAGEAKAALMMRLRSVGVRTVPVLRAMETVPRDRFVDARYAADAQRDIALPIGCGQTTAEPTFIARQIEALDCAPGCRVMEVGSGSGYVSALLAQVAGEVRGLERYRVLAQAAQARLAALDLFHAAVEWADGLDAGTERGPFDRILVHVAVPAPPSALLDRLALGGVMVCPLTAADGRQDLVRFKREGEGSITAVRICAARLQAAATGRSQAL